MTTPNQYPLSVRALQTACNQRSAREPVMELTEADVRQALRELRDQGLARTSPVRGRVARHEHTLEVQLDLADHDQAVLGVLLLRGPQTAGEIRTHTGRWIDADDLATVQEALGRLRDHAFLPLAEELPVEPGRREPRWRHLLGADAGAASDTTDGPSAGPAAVTADSGPAAPTAGGLTERVDALEDQVAALREELATLRREVAPSVEESR